MGRASWRPCQSGCIPAWGRPVLHPLTQGTGLWREEGYSGKVRSGCGLSLNFWILETSHNIEWEGIQKGPGPGIAGGGIGFYHFLTLIPFAPAKAVCPLRPLLAKGSRNAAARSKAMGRQPREALLPA